MSYITNTYLLPSYSYQLAMREACKYVEERLSVKVKEYSMQNKL